MTQPPSPTLVALPAIIADIGGTNGRFAIVARDGSVGPTTVIETRHRPSLDEAIDLDLRPLSPEPIRSAVLAMATVVEGEVIQLTNGPWFAEPRAMIAKGGFSDVIVINDFEALALSLPSLTDADLDPVGPRLPRGAGTRLVIGPGTGLGAAALIDANGVWVPSGGEGGHVDFGPKTARDAAVWPHLPGLFGRISAESVISGTGMVGLYRAVAAADGMPAPLSTAPEVGEAGITGTDPVAVATVDLFCRLLGRYAGDLALIFMAKGGVYIGGGIAPRFAPVLQSGGFREAFLDKAPYHDLLAGFSTAIITHPCPALAGLAAMVLDPARYAIGLAGRRWTA
ncbi:MAG: glucokinase [Bauldia sp.]|nr:glucokinase [Bauldia sp.]